MRSDRLNGAHEIHESVSLEVALAAEWSGGVEEDLLHFVGLQHELSADREKRGDGARHVRRGHAGAAVVEIDVLARELFEAEPLEMSRRDARRDALARRHDVRFETA